MTTFQMSGYTDRNGEVSAVSFLANVATLEAAQELAATFPKSVKAHGVRLGGCPGYTGTVHLTVKLAATKVNGGVNETGLKRYRSFLKAAAKNGYAIEWVARFSNRDQTREEFETRIS